MFKKIIMNIKKPKVFRTEKYVVSKFELMFVLFQILLFSNINLYAFF